MSLIKWSSDYRVNIEEFDEQHKTIIEIINDIFRAIEAKDRQGVIPKTHTLLDYWNIHFRYEEEIMKQIKYPNHSVHKSEHEDICEKVSNLNNLLSNGAKHAASSMSLILNLWVEDHIKTTDKELAAFLNDRGIT